MLLLWHLLLTALLTGAFVTGYVVGGRDFLRSSWRMLVILVSAIILAEVAAAVLTLNMFRAIAGLIAIVGELLLNMRLEEVCLQSKGSAEAQSTCKASQANAIVSGSVMLPVISVVIVKSIAGTLDNWTEQEKVLAGALIIGMTIAGIGVVWVSMRRGD